MQGINPVQLYLARLQAAVGTVDLSDGAKEAAVPATAMTGGGAPAPMDPAMGGGGGSMPPGGGGAPPMDPAMAGGAGGAPPMDPSMMGGMGPGGMPPKGKKAEQMILSSQIRNIMFLLAQLCEKAGITVPPSMLVGPAADPATESAAMQDLQSVPSSPTVGATQQPIPPVQPMTPDQGPIGKAAGVRIGIPISLTAAQPVGDQTMPDWLKKAAASEQGNAEDEPTLNLFDPYTLDPPPAAQPQRRILSAIQDRMFSQPA